MNSLKNLNIQKSKPSTPIFEEYPTHGCDECERWWNSQCDGHKINSKAPSKPCNEFLPTRNVEIPQKIKTLQNDVKWLKWAFGSLVVFLIAILLWGGLVK
jgi:hypothetical protein